MADLHFGPEQPTSDEQNAVDRVLAETMGPAVVIEHERLVRGGQTRRHERRHLLLPVLHALHNQAGWISPGGLNYAAQQLQVPPAEAYGVATFYDMFRVDDPGHDDDVIHVCVDAACQIAGAEETIAALEAGGKHVHRSPCLGQCERPVAQFIQGRAKPDRVDVDSHVEPAAAVPQAGETGAASSLRLLGRVGRADPTSLESYVSFGGYKALAAAFRRGPAGVVDEVTVSGLMGRGGAAFPTGIKWKAVADAPGDHKYV
ncbi:MAG: NAD(P)H-dependent oxidoreductase subunit E, partial [Acidimicrobiia bacterium]|nr:NAD(P)H-dependent oxidoreductase subunit E [Acidimicrobiia bacterium]